MTNIISEYSVEKKSFISKIEFSKVDDDSNKITEEALWDTGASTSVISKSIVKKLGLISESKGNVVGVTGAKERDFYRIKIWINGYDVKCRVPDRDNGISLIGMDVINKGILTTKINNQQKLELHFEIPSQSYQEVFKYHNIYNIQKNHNNELCPCNSGKKYKNCHGQIFKYFDTIL